MTYSSARYAMANRFDRRHLTTIRAALGPGEGHRILEVGCGRGFLAQEIERTGAAVTAVDVNPEAIAAGVASDMREMSGDDLRFPDETFDALYSVHAIEHIPDIEGALTEMHRVLRPGGRLLLVYPAEPIKGLYAIPTSIMLYRTPMRARDIHCHKLTPARLRRYTEPIGLEHVHSVFQLLSTPQFASTFRRPR